MGNTFKKLIRRLKSGDQSAFLPFYEKVAPGLMRYLLWKTSGDRSLCEDVLQDAFVRFLCNLDHLQAEELRGAQAYLLRTVRSCLIDKVARNSFSSKPHIPLESLPESAYSTQGCQQETAVELRELGIAMESLNEKESEIIWLRDALGLSHREVADRVGITEQASRQAYVRAKRSLLSELKLGLSGFKGEGYAVT